MESDRLCRQSCECRRVAVSAVLILQYHHDWLGYVVYARNAENKLIGVGMSAHEQSLMLSTKVSINEHQSSSLLTLIGPWLVRLRSYGCWPHALD
jgi:hypothetical protein